MDVEISPLDLIWPCSRRFRLIRNWIEVVD